MTNSENHCRHQEYRSPRMIKWLVAGTMLAALAGTSHAGQGPAPDRKKAMVTEPGTAPTRESLQKQKLVRDARTRPNQLNPQPLPPEPPEHKQKLLRDARTRPNQLNPQPLPPEPPEHKRPQP